MTALTCSIPELHNWPLSADPYNIIGGAWPFNCVFVILYLYYCLCICAFVFLYSDLCVCMCVFGFMCDVFVSFLYLSICFCVCICVYLFLHLYLCIFICVFVFVYLCTSAHCLQIYIMAGGAWPINCGLFCGRNRRRPSQTLWPLTETCDQLWPTDWIRMGMINKNTNKKTNSNTLTS